MKRLKSIIGVSIALILVMTSSMFVSAKEATDYTNKTITMEQAAGKYKTQGRTEMVGTGLAIDSTATGIEFNADCEGKISVNLKVKASWKHAYITAIVDGERNSHIEAKTTTSEMEDVKLEIATGLTKGEHSVCIYNNTESPFAIMSIESIELNGELLDAPKDNDLYMEFIGDSYFASFGNIIKSTDTQYDLNDNPLVSDGSQSFGYFTAQNLNADYSVLAASGYGLVRGFGDETADTNVAKYYDYTSWERSHSSDSDKWSFNRKADVVVIELCDHELGFAPGNGVTGDIFEAGVKSFLENVRAKNPNAKIVWIEYGWTKKIENVINELGGADKGYYATKLALAGNGGMGHPTAEELKTKSDAFTKYLKDTVLTAKTTTDPIKNNSSVTSTTSNNNKTNSGTAATNSNTNKKSPKTGDPMQTTLYCLLAANILAASVICIAYKAKVSKKIKD